jgi:hypothetical protein
MAKNALTAVVKSPIFIIIAIALIVISVFILQRALSAQTDNIKSQIGFSLLNDYLKNSKVEPDYSVHYASYYSTPGGDRRMNINFEIKNEKFVSCSGNYTGNIPSFVECSLDAIEKNEYPFNSMDSETMGGVMNNLKGYSVMNFSSSEVLNLKDRTCLGYKNLVLANATEPKYTIEMLNFLLCFNDSYLVNYAFNQNGGGPRAMWNVEGFEFTEEMNGFLS